MSISKLPSGRYRVQVYDPLTRENVSVGDILGGPRTFATKREAKAAREKAREKLSGYRRHDITVAAFRERWLTDDLFEWGKESTRIHYRERTSRFAQTYGQMNIAHVGDEVVEDWLRKGNASTVPALRAMFNAAGSAKVGRLVEFNPFAGLGLKRSKGNAEADPPPEPLVWDIIAAGRELSGPFWAAWLQVGAFTGMRPGELDALKWDRIDWAGNRIRVEEQFNWRTGTFTLPKNGLKRWAPLTPQARQALEGLPREENFCFVNSERNHWRHHARLYHWDLIRKGLGIDYTLYVATRHFFGSYAVNVLRLESEDVAFLMGHEDGGEQVRKTYGHRNRAMALDRGVAAFMAHAAPGSAHETTHGQAGNVA